jgi:hypothetical protein
MPNPQARRPPPRRQSGTAYSICLALLVLDESKVTSLMYDRWWNRSSVLEILRRNHMPTRSRRWEKCRPAGLGALMFDSYPLQWVK